MTATVTHQPKAGATLTGTEYEASDHHVVTIAAADIGAAPTTADYLVGTANGDLSAEIVVGTTPGGELGGTWASPTVDATHSGSSHAGVQAAAEATAAAALAAASFAAPALLVAASDASAAVVAAADYVCDGTADDVQINAAITALGGPGAVLLSEGTFTLAAGLRPTSGCRIEGVGSGATTLVLADGADVTVIYNADVSGGNTDIEIKNLAINGNRANQTSSSISCIDLQKVDRFRLVDLRLYDPRISCIALLTCSDGVISGCKMSGGGNDNLLIWTTSHDITVSDCVSSGTVAGIAGSPIASGFEVSDGSYNIAFTNCVAHSNLTAGFALANHSGKTGPFNVTMVGCSAYGNGSYGFYVVAQATGGFDGIVWAGCVASGNTLDGFRVEESSAGYGGRISLGDCIARTNSRFGFVVASVDDVAFDDCLALGNTSFGFNLPSGVDRVQVTGCRSIGNSLGYNIVGDDSSFTGSSASANSGVGFVVQGNRNLLSACRSRNNTGTTGQGFDISAGADHKLTGCVASGNSKDGFLIRASTGVTLMDCQSSSNTTYGMRSLSGATGLRIIYPRLFSNTTADTSWVAALSGFAYIPDPTDLFVGALSPQNAPATSVTVQTASAVVWAAFTVKKPVTVSNVLFRVGVSAGNMDIGLCSVSGSTATRLASTGSFAVPAVAVQNTKALGASVDLIPGTIYLQALAADDVTAGFGGNNLAAMPMQNGSYYDLVGLTAASFPLPASFTLGSTATGKIHCLQFT